MTEFLVEVVPGREVVYRTPLALRAAMRSGEITPDSRIYHRAGSRWIPITEHPEYRKFLAERRPVDWLEPIPFQPVEPEPPPAETPAPAIAAVRGVLHRVGAKFRAWLAKVTAPPELPPKRAAALPEPEPERLRPPKPAQAARPSPPPPAPPTQAKEGPGQPPAAPERRRWTFYP